MGPGQDSGFGRHATRQVPGSSTSSSRAAASAQPFHLVLGDTSAGALREAMVRVPSLAADILRFRDVLALGPLGALGTSAGPASRAGYWGSLLIEAPPAVSEFDEEEGRYEIAMEAARSGRSIFIWTGPHASSQLWLQRLCAALPADAQARLIDLSQAPGGGHPRAALGQFEPGRIPALFALAHPLPAAERERLCVAWRENASIASGVRRWVNARISHHGDDYYDPLLMAQCDADWQPAAQVAGSALWHCDEFLGDVFFAWRLRVLALAGYLDHRGELADLGRAWVRRPRA